MSNAPHEPEPLYAPAWKRKRKSLRIWTGVVTGLTLLLVIWLLLPLLPSSWRREASPEEYCAGNLRGIGSALYFYAKPDPAGMFPGEESDWRQVLLDANIVAERQFTCPKAVAGQVSYFYVPGYGTSSNHQQVIAYENPANHGGKRGHVLFQDGHVEFIHAHKYQALINSLKLPDGRPWAPHLAAEK